MTALTTGLVLISLLLGCTPSASADLPVVMPGGNISGQVIDENGKPVKGAKIVVTGAALTNILSAKTDSSGHYAIPGIAPGPASVTVTAHGFPSQPAVPVTVIHSQTVTLNISLSKNPSPSTPHPDPSTKPAGDFVTVSTNAVAGPMGYVITPSLTSAVQSETTQQQAFDAIQKFNYPSIVFYISSAPLVYLSADKKGQISEDQAKQETDREPLWLDASFTLKFYEKDNNGGEVAIDDSACKDGSTIQIIGMLPQQTTSALKNSTAANVTTAVNSVAGALTSLLPQGSQVSAATNALNVLFQNIFPPQPIAFQYSNITDNCNFGWFFRPNDIAGSTVGQASILGLQTGIVMLKTKKKITKIEVTGRSLSAWNKPPTASSNSLFNLPDAKIATITLPSKAEIDFSNLASLSSFPLLIPKCEAEKILQMDPETTCDDKWTAFACASKLVGTTLSYDFVTNASLNAFLGGTAPSTQGGTQPPAQGGTQPPAQGATQPPAPSQACPAAPKSCTQMPNSCSVAASGTSNTAPPAQPTATK
ncbi:MAG: carboxypeptidase regulatory-like domain-containing protein [Terracidiphilus sp.]